VRENKEERQKLWDARKRRDNTRERKESKAKWNAGRENTVLVLVLDSEDEPKKGVMRCSLVLAASNRCWVIVLLHTHVRDRGGILKKC
jgi:hypothetical protein